MESRHPDVFEMDAASRTGIGDIREILDSVRYAPVMARNKIYIIDEVHMLSTQAFNGLLKTLEEPPPHVKFIFATTEIRKVPVTVLSRCQRFDLKRIDSERLAEHLERHLRQGRREGRRRRARLDRARGGRLGARWLCRCSIRPSCRSPARTVTRRAMCATCSASPIAGACSSCSKRSRKGDAKTAITEVRSQYDSGADPALILRDLLEIGHEAARAQALGADARIIGGADWVARVRALAEELIARAAFAPLADAAEGARGSRQSARSDRGGGNGDGAPLRRAGLAAAGRCRAPAARWRRAERRRAALPMPQRRRRKRRPQDCAAFEDVVALVGDRERQIELQIALERHMRVTRFAHRRDRVRRPHPTCRAICRAG